MLAETLLFPNLKHLLFYVLYVFPHCFGALQSQKGVPCSLWIVTSPEPQNFWGKMKEEILPALGSDLVGRNYITVCPLSRRRRLCKENAYFYGIFFINVAEFFLKRWMLEIILIRLI